MNTSWLVGLTAGVALLAGCASAPVQPPGSAEARSKLMQLQSNGELASRAPVAIQEADLAVTAAETPEPDAELAAHRVYLADRKVDTARALAETRFAEDQRGALARQRETARLDARTREADAANAQAATAEAARAAQKQAADQARQAADQARSDTSAAQLATAQANEQSADLQRQIDELQARPTDRGLVLTLGDVLFATGKSDLISGASGNLDKLVTFLNSYPDRTVIIEGYTDSVGSEAYNQDLSERRAASVRSYLASQGIASTRLSSSGKGEFGPVADNDSATGRQQNRRVEVIISNPVTALR